MIVMQVHKPEIEVLDTHDQHGVAIKVLVLIDPATGFQVHAPMKESTASECGARLLEPPPEPGVARPRARVAR